MDLTPFAGGPVLVRFNYVTDESINNAGWCVDDVSVPELGIEEPFPLDDATRERFLEGLDDIGITMRSTTSIDDYEQRRSAWLPVTD